MTPHVYGTCLSCCGAGYLIGEMVGDTFGKWIGIAVVAAGMLIAVFGGP